MQPITTRLRTGTLTTLVVLGLLLTSCNAAPPPVVVDQGSATAPQEKSNTPKNAVLADAHGLVQSQIGTGAWTTATLGLALKAGQHIRTGALSNAMLTFYDGSLVYLGAQSELALDALDARTSGPRVIQLTQVTGTSRHTVAPSSDPDSHYDVSTPDGNARASGTLFAVQVYPDQLSQFWVEAGVISVINMNVSVTVAAGQTTISRQGTPPSAPATSLTGEGLVQSTATAQSTNLHLASVPSLRPNQKGKVTLCHATGSATNPYVQITVSSAGAANGHAKHAGDIIPAPAGGCPRAAPNPQPIPTSTRWTIAGTLLTIGATTIIIGNPQAGDWVRFEAHLLADGSYFADRIVFLCHNPFNQFTLIGTVQAISTTAWTVSGRVFRVDQATSIEAGLKLGASVQVLGTIATDGSLYATHISQTQGVGSNFRFVGVITSITNDVWVISGIKVIVSPDVANTGAYLPGISVSVNGVINASGQWVATTLSLITPDTYRFEFVGVVQNLTPWTVSNVSFDTTSTTDIDTAIQVGSTVRVTGLINSDGVWVATQITRLDAEHVESFDLIGPVLSMTPWNVRGIALLVDTRTTLKDEIKLCEMVKVTGWILADGTWLATEIKHTGLHLGQVGENDCVQKGP